MERDVAIAYGASELLRERLMGVSDEYPVVYCRVCGFFAVNDPNTDSYRACSLCGTKDKFGKTSIPYVYKYLSQLLAAPGIFLRPELITNEEYAARILPKSKYISETENDEMEVDENEEIDEGEDADIQLKEESEDEYNVDEYNEDGDYAGEDYGDL